MNCRAEVDEGCVTSVWLLVAISCTGYVAAENDFEIRDGKGVDVVMMSKLTEACNDEDVDLVIFDNCVVKTRGCDTG